MSTLSAIDFSPYTKITPFSDFAGFSAADHYHALPEDWIVVIADIKGSTKAIAEGRYKDVNMVGAACITACLNVLCRSPIPFVFGGDGATLAMPQSCQEIVADALSKTRAMAMDQFGLGLRIGFIPIKDIVASGRQVLVAKYQVNSNNHIALFRGGGIEWADTMLKQPDSPYALEEYSTLEHPDLEGLSCRWEPLQSQQGQIASILILAQDKDEIGRQASYREVHERLCNALQCDLASLSPVKPETLKFRWPPRNLMLEVRTLGSSFKRFCKVLGQSLIQFYLHKTHGKIKAYDAPAYLKDMTLNTDFQRFDDMLRLVLDLSRDQIAAALQTLETLHQEKRIYYGLHQSDSALMTCLVFSTQSNGHIHFIDGGDGGFALAANQLKKQMSSPD